MKSTLCNLKFGVLGFMLCGQRHLRTRQLAQKLVLQGKQVRLLADSYPADPVGKRLPTSESRASVAASRVLPTPPMP